MNIDYSEACVQVDISDEDIFKAMSEIPGHLDISLGDFKEIYIKAYEQAIRRFTRDIKCSEIMSRSVISLFEDDPLHQGALILAQHNFSGAPVVDRRSHLVGVVSQKDFLEIVGVGGLQTIMQLVAECLSGTRCIVSGLRKGHLKDIMKSPVVTAFPETSAHEVADMFVTRKINRVPIVDHDGSLIGIVTRTDIVRSTLRRL